MAPKFNINSRRLTAPLAAFVMASILFVYSRTSIQAAKRNAQKHREADGGQISWRNESLRRHGVLEPPEDQGAVRQLLLGGVSSSSGGGGGGRGKKSGGGSDDVSSGAGMGGKGTGKIEGVQGLGRTEEEEKVRAAVAGRGRGRGREGE